MSDRYDGALIDEPIVERLIDILMSAGVRYISMSEEA